MPKLRPAILIGIGPQAQRTVQRFVRCVRDRQGKVPAMLPVLLDFVPEASPFRRESDGVQYLTLSPPVFKEEAEWPAWLPPELGELTSAQRERTRAWMRAALFQVADDLQEFLLDSIPRLSSFAAVEEMNARGLSLAGDSEINVYVVADLGDHVGSSVFVDTAYLTSYVCRQLGLRPRTVGLLYLPSATSPAPVEEAVAYAALKELEYYFRSRTYDGDLVPDRALTGGFVPFNDGCYLLDSLNELGYTLQDTSQLVSAVSEWLYAMTFLGMAEAIRERRARRYLTATLRGKARAYESFGIAVRYVPRQLLADWATGWLGSDILRRMLTAQAEVDPDKRARSFVQALGLQVDVLESILRQQSSPEGTGEVLSSLQRAGVRQIELRARQVLQAIRERQLPSLQANLEGASLQLRHETRETIVKEVRSTLEDVPVGGVTLASRVLDRLYDQVSAFQKEAKERAQSHRVALRRSLATVSETYYTLRSVAMSIPPWPISILGVLALFILPLLYVLRLVRQVIYPLNQTWGAVSLGTLILGVLGVLGFVAYRFARQMRRVRDQHVRMIQERFELESSPLIYQAMNAIYDAAQEAIAQARTDLYALSEQLQAVVARFQSRADESAGQLRELASPGPFRSVVDPEREERFLKGSISDLDQLIVAFTQQVGCIPDWQVRSAESGQSLATWLSTQLSLRGNRYLEQPLRGVAVMGVLTHGLQADGVSRILERMFESAYPLWNYEPRFLRRAKTQRLPFVGIDTSGAAWANLVGPLVRVRSDVIPIDTGDPFAMVILNVHRGVPLFALRRISEYRAHYAEMLWRSKMPVHTMRTEALADDLIPVRRRLRLSVSTLFATGLALGSIGRSADGRYFAPRARGQTIRLSTRKERSAILMGMDAAACREVRRQLDALIAQKGKEAVHTILDEYLTGTPGLEDWEVRGILDYGRSCRLADRTAQEVGQQHTVSEALR